MDNRLAQNTTGAFYVDDSCIDCDHCRSLAPQFFTRSDDEGMSYIHRQPVTEEEIALAQEALEGCPSESIGSDGACDHRKRHRARQIVFSDSTQ